MTAETSKGTIKMKLTFSPASPFARKVRIAAIETGLIDKIELVPTTVVPGQPNDEYTKLYPLKKLPALIADNGEVIVDSYVIVEYLDELAGGGKLIPASGPTRWSEQPPSSTPRSTSSSSTPHTATRTASSTSCGRSARRTTCSSWRGTSRAPTGRSPSRTPEPTR